MYKITALLPMKGVSERIPKKNLKLFGSKPLFHHILNSLIDSKYISNVVVNTDCKNIKLSILDCFDNITIHDRAENIVGNYVSMNKIIEWDIDKIESDFFIQTHSTNPLITTKTIDLAISKFLENKDKFDSLFSVTKIQKRFYNSNSKPFNHNPQMLTTQHLVPLYEENSCIYIFSKSSFHENNGRIGKNPLMFETNKIESIDIDDINDFKIAELIHKSL